MTIKSLQSFIFDESPYISRTSSSDFDNYLSFIPNLKSAISSTNVKRSDNSVNDNYNSIVIILVGLPASGKSTLAKYLLKYLISNHNIKSKIYNAGNIRRNINPNENNDFFFNRDHQGLRDQVALIAFDNCLEDLTLRNISVGIFDATNSTKQRREKLFNIIRNNESYANIKPLIIDIKCSNLKYWKFNMELKINSSPDYIKAKDKTHYEKLTNFIDRTFKYLEQYEPVTKNELNAFHCDYMVIDNYGEYVNYFKNQPFINSSEDFNDETEEDQLTFNVQRSNEPHSMSSIDDILDSNNSHKTISIPSSLSSTSTNSSTSSTTKTLNNTYSSTSDYLVNIIYQFLQNYYNLHSQGYIKKFEKFLSYYNNPSFHKSVKLDLDNSPYQENSAIQSVVMNQKDDDLFNILYQNSELMGKIFQPLE